MNERDIFIAALEIESPSDRQAFLEEVCGRDTSLRERVEALLAAHQKGNSFLESPPVVAPGGTVDQPITEAPGTVIGPYKLLQQIGEGGMGVVYMAEQTEPVERRVALKIIKPGMDTRQVIARFEAERHALAMMDHPNIARVLDAGTTETGRPYFVMELVKGVPITQYSDEHHLTPQQRLELFVPVCHAVQHAHQKGIIHRDIKPTNVLVAEYDDRPVPKIIDFGVAKAIQQRLTERTVFTQLGQVVGTIDYMSPEQAKLNELDVDTRSDVYSLGVLLYELLTGETPFDRERLRAAAFDELLRIIREEEPPKPSLRLSSSESLPSIAALRQIEPKKLSTLVRGELDWIVMKALEKDRARRYETANALAADVQHYLADEPVVACPPSAGYRFRKFARRNKVVLAFVGAIALTLLIGAAIATGQAIRATRAERLAKWQEQIAVEQQRLAQDAAEREKALRLVAEEERQRAETNRQRAEANLRLALEALDEVYLRVTERRGPRGVQPKNEEEALLESTLNFYERFADANRMVPETRSLVEDVYAKLLTIRRELVEQFPHVVGYRRALGVATVGLASLLESAGRSDEAKETYEQAARVQAQLVDSFPAVVEYRAELAVTHGRLATLPFPAGQDDAEEHRRQADALRSGAESAAPPKTTAPHQFNGFADTSGLELFKDASVVDDRLRLTPNKPSQSGACWIIEKQPVAFGFDTEFQFQLSGGADGFAFVIQNQELSVGGNVLGYEMPNSLAIEFDTFHHPYDPPGDHMSVQTNGTGRNSISHAYSLGAIVPPLQLDDNTRHTARIRYVPGTLSISLDDLPGPLLTVPVELAAALHLEAGRAWVGFTAGTGSVFQNHDVLSWEFRLLVDQQAADAFLTSYPAKAADEPHPPPAAVKGEARPPDALQPSPENFPFLRSALAFYETFAEQNQGGSDSQWEIGKAFLRVGQIETTLGQSEPAEQHRQRAVRAFDACRKLSVAEYRNGNRESADALLGRLEEVRGNLGPAADLLLVMTHWELGSRQEACFRYLSVARELEKDGAPPMTELLQGILGEATELLGLKEISSLEDRTVAVYRRLAEEDPKTLEHSEELEDARLVRAYLELDREAPGRGHADKAREFFVAAARREGVTDPTELEYQGWFRRGLAFGQSDEWAKAEHDFSRAVELVSDDPLSWLLRARSYAERGEFEKTGTDLARAAPLKPKPGSMLDAAELQFALGRLFWDADRLPEAHRLWQAALAELHNVAQQSPEDRDIQARVASCEQGICDHYGSMGLWDLGLPKHTVSFRRGEHWHWASLLALSGQQEAWREYCQYFAVEMREIPYRIPIGCLLDPPGMDPKPLMAPLEELVRNRKADHFRHLYLAFAQCRTGRYDDAVETIEAHPAFQSWDSVAGTGLKPTASYLLAIAAHGAGDGEKAAGQLDRAEGLYQKIAQATLTTSQRKLFGTYGDNCKTLAYAQVLRREAWQKIKGQSPPAEPWWTLVQARGYGLLGESRQAEQQLAAAVAAAPNDPQVWIARSCLFEQLGDSVRAEADWSRGIKLAPDDPLPWIQRARRYAERGELDKADGDLARAASLAPNPASALDLAELRFALGRRYWEADRLPNAHRLWQGALADLHQLAMESPEDQGLQQRVASCDREMCRRYGLMGLWDLAATLAQRNAATKRLGDYPDNINFAVLLAVNEEQETWREYCQYVLHQLREKRSGNPPSPQIVRTSCLLEPPAVDAGECITLAAEFLASQPADPLKRYFPEVSLALAQCRASQYGEALKTLEANPHNRSGESISGSSGSRLLGGYVYALAAHGDGRNDDALAQLERAEALYQETCKAQLATKGTELAPPFSPYFWDLVAAQVVRREAWQKIKGQSPPAEPWWPLVQARGYALLGESERADQQFAAAVAADPDDPEIWIARARLFEQLGDVSRAEADWNKAVELAPDDRLHWMQRAVWCAEHGQQEKADADLAQAASLAPKRGSELELAQVRFALGQAYSDTGRPHDAHRVWQAALADLDQFAKHDPKDQTLQQQVASVERQICRRSGGIGLWEPATTGPTSRSRPTPFPLDQWVELLPRVDSNCYLKGVWERSGDALVTDPKASGNPSRLAFPVEIDGSYDLQLDFAVISGPLFWGLALPVGDTQCEVFFGMNRTHYDGIQWIEGRAIVEVVDGQRVVDKRNPSAREGRTFEAGDHSLLVQVRVKRDSASIEVSRDGKPYLHWKGKQAALTLPEASYRGLGPKRPGLSFWDGMTNLNRVRIRPVSDSSLEHKESQQSSKP